MGVSETPQTSKRCGRGHCQASLSCACVFSHLRTQHDNYYFYLIFTDIRYLHSANIRYTIFNIGKFAETHEQNRRKYQ